MKAPQTDINKTGRPPNISRHSLFNNICTRVKELSMAEEW